ncbi:ATPase [Leptospira tipperaryensis]|uniref:ATPase n=1 Tax=Leptospira tipperaryensis TaxID=2564040 RepID=A0A1D7V3B3_9LEPT|nr:SRPBCC domain-containing protein [Leptospira tipperaryensis]AOP36293.1 ATPase [Leptospira tipperaryensis]
MQKLKVAHEIFSIEKIYKSSAESVYSAWSNLESKAQWFIGPGDWSVVKRELDFRVGGKELLHGRFPNGKETLYKAEFYNILPNERIVFVYDMYLSNKIHSVSIASVEIESINPKDTRLTFTEQVAFLDETIGREGLLSRKEGTMAHLDRIVEYLKKSSIGEES